MAEDLNLTESSYGTDTAPSDSVVISVDLLDHLVTVVRRYPFTNDGSTLSSMETLLAQLEEVRNSARRP